MKNKVALEHLCKQLCVASEKIVSIVSDMSLLEQACPDLLDIYEHFLLDEVAHVQILGLEMTRTVTEENAEEEEENTDEGIFGPGELESVVGEEEEKEPPSDQIGGLNET